MGGKEMQLPSNQTAETAVQQAQAGTQAPTSRPISTLYLKLMWSPSNRMHKSFCHTFFPPILKPLPFPPTPLTTLSCFKLSFFWSLERLGGL